MHSPHLTSTAEALRRVFAPNLNPQLTRPYLRSLQSAQLPISQRRYARFEGNVKGHRSQGEIRPQKDTGPIRDEAIRAQEIQIVNPDKSLQPPRRLRDTLASIDRRTCSLIQVGEKIHPQYGNDPGSGAGEADARPRIPICKVVDKGSFRLAEAAKHKTKKGITAQTKELELNWTISQNDMNHRLDRLKEFLDKGRRVEVVFGKRRRGWMQRREVTDEEAKAILQQIREAAGTVEGAKEWKTMEGQVRGPLIMFFEAKRDRPEVEAKKK